MTGEVYIHYGADAFDPSHGFPVVNTKYSWAKPHGGLWASRKRASYGWAKWCEENSFRDCAAEPSFQFIMRNPEKVAVIHNLNDLRQLPMVRDVPPGMWEEIDFVDVCGEELTLLNSAGMGRNTKTSGPMIYISLCMGGTVTPLWSSIPTQ